MTYDDPVSDEDKERVMGAFDPETRTIYLAPDLADEPEDG